MSRHHLPSIDGWHTVAVGWDAGMNTFFAQVLDPVDEVTLDRGSPVDPINDPAEVINLVRDHVFEIPASMTDQLSADRDAEPHDAQRLAEVTALLTNLRNIA
ncbi:hypothetical protein [Actinoalloteichus sp. GBA129-24]|uniref:hypothetical protein n=1 Tax=Actinoalloteichus sp. GBA129-24 TaxID=1612551 RepID=UPI0009509DF9|nr:hypothetical protein [Actinoalloteichus sp. GBA129-24]APU18606.1 hypothetical protein UA75_02835 [Actinoalloteichus sp. GBA129-24]